MGKLIEFAANDQTFTGYLAEPAQPGPSIIVIQEWWGLVGHIKSVCDRFAKAGFTALAPDFYHGKTTAEPDEAGSMMMALNIPDAAHVIKAAANYLKSDKVGVVGFCMGGQLALFAAGLEPKIAACVNFYGIHPNVTPDYSKFKCPVLGFFAEHDEYANTETINKLDQSLEEANVPHNFHTYPGTHHAFFNDDRIEVYNRDAAEDSWQKMLDFFNTSLTTQ
jgi:carboxymethylenebutenolidase